MVSWIRTYLKTYTVNFNVVQFILNQLYLNESLQNMQDASNVQFKENLEH